MMGIEDDEHEQMVQEQVAQEQMEQSHFNGLARQKPT